ncbi:MAG: 16S rRNA (guanine(966)-N(2))-methyltransferase RsmD [Hyphomicrobiaceae bacterium]
MRIVAGRFKGRAVATPAHEGVRPTSDRVREAVFNILSHGVREFDIAGTRVIDLFAGTGALGLEALSRGAAYCLFVEQDARSRALVRRNVEAFELTGVTRIWRRDAIDLGPAGNITPFDLAFIDPPYGQGLGDKALASLMLGGWLRPGAIAVLEEARGNVVSLALGLEEIDRRAWGDTEVRILAARG